MVDTTKINVPDIGGATNVDVIEILVKEGDTVELDTPLITLESDKASMEIPSPKAGVVESIQVKLGDKISEGSVILTLKESANNEEVSEEPKKEKQPPKETPKEEEPPKEANKEEELPKEAKKQQDIPLENSSAKSISASPGVRRLARELGVDLSKVPGTGRKSRVSKEDITQYIKNLVNEKSSGQFSLPEAPLVDFSKFGTVEVKPLNKIKRLTGEYLHRAWLTIPHVTQFDEADITELENFRKQEAENTVQAGYKLTLLAFVCKTVCKALVQFPQFNSSLDVSGQNLIYKQYFNIGIAVETPNGLVVPVIKGVDQLSVSEIAREMGRISTKAREKGLTPAEMSGGCFTISSLGGIGGTLFTPIVNSPEVAILGLSKSVIKPIYKDNEFIPRLMLPLSLSYDHRVIDGAEGARFIRFISESLSDIRRILL